MLKQDLKKIIKIQKEDLKENFGIKREFKIEINSKFVTIITGIRRCGKSTLVKQYLKNKKVYYAYFEDLFLNEFELRDFLKLEELFKEEIGENGIYFFDEIQNITGWEKYIRQLVDRGEKVIITGSNASLMSKELGTRLTGRHISYDLYPFSYGEYLILLKKRKGLDSFKDYFKKGGFPEYLKLDKKEILQTLLNDILYRDIITRNELRSESEIKSLLNYLISNIGKEISYNKLKEIVGFKSTNSIIQIIDYFENSYLLFQLKRFNYSIKKQQFNPKKIYCIDNGLINVNAFKFSEDYGRLLENLVFIELKRRGKDIFYHKNKKECDFVIKEGLKIAQAIQVTKSLSDLDTRKREIDGLLEALKDYKLNEGLILTEDEEDVLKIENKTIYVKPVWKWLLENKVK